MKNVSLGWIGRTLRKPWYAFWRFVQKYGYQGHEYVLHVPFGHMVYTPWFWTESDFSKLLRAVSSAGPMAVSADRCYVLYKFCQRSLNLNGDIAECGVYTGGTAHLLAATIQDNVGRYHPKLHLFDTFSGMPDVAVPERDYHSPGDFGDVSLERVQQRLGPYPFVQFHPGLMPQTFERVADVRSYSLVHVDVDIYLSVLECCRWFWPRLCRGGGNHLR